MAGKLWGRPFDEEAWERCCRFLAGGAEPASTRNGWHWPSILHIHDTSCIIIIAEKQAAVDPWTLN
jgi:hypothetical protein